MTNAYAAYPQQQQLDGYQAYQALQYTAHPYHHVPAQMAPTSRPSWLPANAQAVTLHGTLGWFIPDPSAADVNMQHPQQQQQQIPRNQMDTSNIKRSRGGAGGGTSVANPGLDGSEVCAGTVKYPVNPDTGYGFIASEAVQVLHPGKDCFLHQKLCPWVTDLNLTQGESVQFNFIVNAKGSPQVSRIVRASS